MPRPPYKTWDKIKLEQEKERDEKLKKKREQEDDEDLNRLTEQLDENEESLDS